MRPRITGPEGLRVFSLCLRPAPRQFGASLQPLMQTANISLREKKRKMKMDPYGWAQEQQRKAARVEKRAVIDKALDEAWGSPVHGITTPFVESFDSGGQAPFSTPPVDEDGNPLEEPHALPTSPHVRNYLLSADEVVDALSLSERLTKPLEPEARGAVDPVLEAEAHEEHERHHRNAVEAITRIADLNNGTAKDRKHANIRRCIDVFGRHNTDHTIPNAAPPRGPSSPAEPKPPRAGPDTGSSEVQIAILTAKIRALALELEGPKGHRDKNNKRSLRLLCHKRQRLLRYMERKDRNSGRWKHMIETLGLSPATWKEQITL